MTTLNSVTITPRNRSRGEGTHPIRQALTSVNGEGKTSDTPLLVHYWSWTDKSMLR
uniref:Uncharacterized protein n=1 Tax=Anopheles quadriannulatus TaxID=34691 RepID=A0A182XRW8_ANOQN